MDIKPKNWLLIRGLARERRHWGKFPVDLEAALDSSKVFTLELPGVGKKSEVDAYSTIGEYADHLRSEWLHLKSEHPGPWGIIAISMGGMISMNWCSRYPHDMAALVLLNSSAGNLSPPHHRFSPKAMGMVLKLFFKENYLEREESILKLTTHKTHPSSELIKEYASYSQEHPIKRKNFIKQIYAASKFIVPEELKLNLLILAGKYDSLASYECSKTLSRHFSVNYFINEEAGHDLPLDDPSWVIERIKSFLN